MTKKKKKTQQNQLLKLFPNELDYTTFSFQISFFKKNFSYFEAI